VTKEIAMWAYVLLPKAMRNNSTSGTPVFVSTTAVKSVKLYISTHANGKAVRKPINTVKRIALGTFRAGSGVSSAKCVALSRAANAKLGFINPTMKAIPSEDQPLLLSSEAKTKAKLVCPLDAIGRAIVRLTQTSKLTQSPIDTLLDTAFCQRFTMAATILSPTAPKYTIQAVMLLKRMCWLAMESNRRLEYGKQRKTPKRGVPHKSTNAIFTLAIIQELTAIEELAHTQYAAKMLQTPVAYARPRAYCLGARRIAQ
jgi:hypothetical protein